MAESRVGIVTIRSFNDVQAVGDEYRGHRTIEFRLHGADNDLARRVLDFATGLVHGDGGAVTRLDEHRFRLIPGPSSQPGASGDREPRTPRPVVGAGSAAAPVPRNEPSMVDAVSPDLLAAQSLTDA